MGKSVKRTRKGGFTCCESEKSYKQERSGARRARLRDLLSKCDWEASEVDPPRSGYGPKDGKRWFSEDEWKRERRK